MELTVSGGRISGTESGGVAAFKGIPYAAPPFGELRFRAPAPVRPWDGVRDCTAFGATVPKAPYRAPFDALLPEPSIPGEDCLNLNVWTPAPIGADLPVMVWLHGGAFVNGSGAVPVYDGTAFARDGVVLVSINYRLGIDGFLFFDDDGAENRGLLDQVAALQWVRDNIAVFGGDPGNVTVFGESAGAMSCTSLLSMPMAAGLFQRVITQSGAGQFALAPATARLVAGHVADVLGVPATREALGALPVERIVEAQQAVATLAQTDRDPARWGEIVLNSMAFEPVIDGTVLPQLPLTAIQNGAGSDVDVLTGTTTDEHRLFLMPTGVADFVTDDLLALALMGYRLPADALEVYRSAEPSASPGELLSAVATDWFFRMPAIRLAEAKRSGRTFMYEFAWRSPAYGGKLRACHALELGFVFDNLDAAGQHVMQGDSTPQELADAMHAAWVAFARTGDPGWPSYDLQSRVVQVFGDTVQPVEDPRREQRELWEGVR